VTGLKTAFAGNKVTRPGSWTIRLRVTSSPRRHTTWSPALEPLDLGCEPGVEIPLLGYVAAGQPVDLPEDRETVTVPRHMVRKNSYALRVRGHSMIDDAIQDGDIIGLPFVGLCSARGGAPCKI
jgi:SOS-response transcriptional repressor LexA